MKKLFTNLKVIAIALLLLHFTACTKSNNEKQNADHTSSITYTNTTFTPISITVNGVTQAIAVGSNVTFTGKPNSIAEGGAFTSGMTSNGLQTGLRLTWAINTTFPGSGDTPLSLFAANNVFFLRLTNFNPVYPFTQLLVNYGLQAQSSENIIVPNDGRTYNIGYYYAYTNSNVRTQNGTIYWAWYPLNLTFQQNQSISLSAS